jgi:hypothetical protein
LTLLDAAYLLSLVGKQEPADGVILSVGLGGLASLTFFIADAFISASQAEAIANIEEGRRAQGPTSRGMWTPFITRDTVNPQRLATGLAWNARF